jgi:hypothetical protein
LFRTLAALGRQAVAAYLLSKGRRTMRYLLLATLSAIAFGQSPEAATLLATKADKIVRSAANATRVDSERMTIGNISPVLLQDVTRRPVQWTLRRSVCPLLASDVTGTGQGRTTITLVRNPDSTFNYKIADEVIGTATDGNNRRYIFMYSNNSFVDSGTGIPRPKLPHNVYGTDVFQLIPVDGGTGYTTNIFFRLRLNADGSFTDQGSLFGPNAFCDPI